MSRRAIQTLAGLLMICVVPLLGCGPSQSQVKADKERVDATPQAAVLLIDESALTRITSAESSDPPKTHAFKDAIVRATGVVAKIDIERSKDGSNAIVRLQLSSEPPFEAKCFFSTTDEAAVQKLQIGETVHLKGVCKRIFKDWMEITGCTLDNKNSG